MNKIPDNLKLDKVIKVGIDLSDSDKDNIIKFLDENKTKHIRVSTILEGETSWSGHDMTYTTGFQFLSYIDK